MASTTKSYQTPKPMPTIEHIRVTNDKLKYTNSKYKKVSAKIYDYKCDVKLKVGPATFKAHKDVLSEASDYFSAMFSHDMLERGQDVIEIYEISPKGFSSILDYFYHGYVTLEPGNIEDLLEGARFFQVEWLVEICCDFLVRHMSLESYPAVLLLADTYCLGDLRWDIARFLGENLVTLSEQENFYQNLSYELLQQFLKENIYLETSEGYILKVVLDWAFAFWNERSDQLLTLLKEVRFAMLDMEELDSLPQEVLQYPEIAQEVRDARGYLYDLNRQCLRKGDKYLPRGSREVVFMLAASEFANGTSIMYRDLEHRIMCQEEISTSGLDTELEFAGQVKMGNFIYAMGGYNSHYCSTGRMFSYDPRYREWTELASMLQPRVSFAVCASDRRIYVIGGIDHVVRDDRDEEIILHTVEEYWPEDNAWHPLPPLPHGTYDQSSAFCMNSVYVSGGISADPEDPMPVSYVYRLDVKIHFGNVRENGKDIENEDSVGGGGGEESSLQVWNPVLPMLHSRKGHSMTSSNGRLYVIGGKTNRDVATLCDCLANEMYDPETGQWTEICPTRPDMGRILPYTGLIRNQISFLARVNWKQYLFFYDIDLDEFSQEGEYCGGDITRITTLHVAYPHAI